MTKEPLLISNRNNFIEDNKTFIYKCASKVCSRKLDWLNDDELSLALIAFNTACDTYNKDKGNFYSYAKVLMKNAIIDSFRKSKASLYMNFNEETELINYIDNKEALSKFEIEEETKRKAEEISVFKKEMSQYKLSLEDLIDGSPSHVDTRSTLLNIAFKCSKEDTLLNYIKTKKNLPLKQIILLTNTKRRVLEKWRKYLLALILILSSEDYNYIKSYFNIKVGKGNE
ncbi:MAG TPA: sigma factor [Clostridiaceae bacterium]